MQIKQVKEDIGEFKQANDLAHTEIKDCLERVQVKIDNLGSRFASKKIEVMVYSILGFIFVTLVSTIGYLLDKFVLH